MSFTSAFTTVVTIYIYIITLRATTQHASTGTLLRGPSQWIPRRGHLQGQGSVPTQVRVPTLRGASSERRRLLRPTPSSQIPLDTLPHPPLPYAFLWRRKKTRLTLFKLSKVRDYQFIIS